jgi:D-glycero-D-manno-heptose 1,7-bisphosphate phosphatase
VVAEPNRAVFFDRDGVLNELVLREGIGVSPRRFEDFRLCRGAMEAVQRVRGLGLLTFVTTNQPDIARGLMAPQELNEMTTMLQATLPLDEIVVCPHDDGDRCPCRKPRPGMLHTLAARWNLTLSESFVVGDSCKDIEAGRQAGCHTVLIEAVHANRCQADIVVTDLDAAVTEIEALISGTNN